MYRVPQGFRVPVAPYPMPYPRWDGLPFEGDDAASTLTFNSGNVALDPAEGEYLRFDAEKVLFVADRGGAPVVGLPGYREVLVDISAAATNDDLANAFGTAIDSDAIRLIVGVAGPVVNLRAEHAGAQYENNVLPKSAGVPVAILLTEQGIDPMWARAALWGPQRAAVSTLSPNDPFEFPRPG